MIVQICHLGSSVVELVSDDSGNNLHAIDVDALIVNAYCGNIEVAAYFRNARGELSGDIYNQTIRPAQKDRRQIVDVCVGIAVSGKLFRPEVVDLAELPKRSLNLESDLRGTIIVINDVIRVPSPMVNFVCEISDCSFTGRCRFGYRVIDCSYVCRRRWEGVAGASLLTADGGADACSDCDCDGCSVCTGDSAVPPPLHAISVSDMTRIRMIANVFFISGSHFILLYCCTSDSFVCADSIE